LSYQRAHRDYANANPQAQQQWVETVKKNFSTSNLRRRWCSLTSSPFMIAPVCSMVGQSATLVQRSAVMSALGTNSTGSCAWTLAPGEEFLRLSPHAKTEDISLYLAEFCLDCVELGVSKICIILDNNPTHQRKMRVQLATHLQQMGLAQEITVEFLYVPPSSPKLNLVEYVIHLLRLRFLHHLPLGTTLVEIEQQLEQFLQSHQFLGSQQVRKTLNFIFSLVA
jgi:hypothetical protein